MGPDRALWKARFRRYSIWTAIVLGVLFCIALLASGQAVGLALLIGGLYGWLSDRRKGRKEGEAARAAERAVSPL